MKSLAAKWLRGKWNDGIDLKRLSNEYGERASVTSGEPIRNCLRGLFRNETSLCHGDITKCAYCGWNSPTCRKHLVNGFYCSEVCELAQRMGYEMTNGERTTTTAKMGRKSRRLERSKKEDMNESRQPMLDAGAATQSGNESWKERTNDRSLGTQAKENKGKRRISSTELFDSQEERSCPKCPVCGKTFHEKESERDAEDEKAGYRGDRLTTKKPDQPDLQKQRTDDAMKIRVKNVTDQIMHQEALEAARRAGTAAKRALNLTDDESPTMINDRKTIDDYSGLSIGLMTSTNGNMCKKVRRGCENNSEDDHIPRPRGGTKGTQQYKCRRELLPTEILVPTIQIIPPTPQTKPTDMSIPTSPASEEITEDIDENQKRKRGSKIMGSRMDEPKGGTASPPETMNETDPE